MLSVCHVFESDHNKKDEIISMINRPIRQPHVNRNSKPGRRNKYVYMNAIPIEYKYTNIY